MPVRAAALRQTKTLCPTRWEVAKSIGWKTMDLFIGISGGHTQSQAVAVRDVEIVGSAVGESLNYHTYGPDAINRRATNLLSNLAASMEVASIEKLVQDTRRITLALPGVTTNFDLTLGADCLANRGWTDPGCLQVVDDTWAGLIAGALSRTGICAIAGTGASVFIGVGDFLLGKARKLDGFGPVLGDWGSGFRLACHYLEDVGRCFDNELEVPLLSELVQAVPQIEAADGIQNWFDGLCRANPHDWRVYFAKVAAVVTRAAERENPEEYAIDLVKRSAGELVETIRMALTRAASILGNRTDLTVDSLKIACRGGQFENSIVYFNEVKKSLAESHPANEVVLAQFTPVVGAVLMSRADDGTIPAAKDVSRITDSIRRHPNAVQHRLVVSQGAETTMAPESRHVPR